jgi:hypothetical protein
MSIIRSLLYLFFVFITFILSAKLDNDCRILKSLVVELNFAILLFNYSTKTDKLLLFVIFSEPVILFSSLS